MRILFNDVIQKSDAPEQLQSPALADVYTFKEKALTIVFDEPVFIDCVGLGNCSVPTVHIIARRDMLVIDGGDANNVSDIIINGGSASQSFDTVIDGNEKKDVITVNFLKDGLYITPRNDFLYDSVEIRAPIGTTVGRLAMGRAVDVPTSVAKEPGFFSTAKPRKTLSGQVICGAGGYNYRVVSLDSRYKLGREALAEIEAGYKTIGAGYPFFIDLSTESYKLPFDKLYATEKNQLSMSFEGGARQFLYSRRWNFEEAF